MQGEYSNTYNGSIDKKTHQCWLCCLNWRNWTDNKAPKCGDGTSITKYKNASSKGYTENWSEEISLIDCVLKTNPWTHKVKYLNR